MTTEMTDTADWRRAAGATGVLRVFNDAGAIEAADVLVAQRLTALGGETDELVALAIAFVVRAVRGGSVCVALTSVPEQVEIDGLPWPAPQEWLAAVAASPLLGSPPVLHLEDDLLYFDRYWLEERQVATDVLALTATRPHRASPDITRLFPAGYDEQRRAAEVALSQGLTVLTGGPGTGKTTTVARLLALMAEQAELEGTPRPRIALAAPTGKAAARLQEAVQFEVDQLAPRDRERLAGLRATTVHRLLGPLPRTSARFRHHRANRLPHDVIVVDETSMVSLTMMARLVEAVRPESRLLLVGDPDQLASVEAGAVLADLVDGLSARGDTPVARLITPHRFGASIGALALAIRVGDANRALDVLTAGGDHIEWVNTEDPAAALRDVLVPHALRLREAAVLGNGPAALAALESHRLLCAHRRGPHGVAHWNRQVERWLAEETDTPLWTSWYAGRPVLVTANDYGLRLYNGDVGVTVMRGGVLRAVMAGADGQAEFATSRLADIETMHAMTIHKSQGSQVGEVTVLLPPTDSRLLSRELLYTAVTRARTKVRVVGSAEQLRSAVARRAARASGLSRRLQD
ncbi:exodeoxyribonuclease V subunit alpha [Mycobacterium sp. shizuoka-1]|uniref:exodeoxyribonuclease V subunit alpha n=1 Tax=Mycobacterium sp. shizuoka-1 TaxID=2039281 RepID=UPI000C0676B2|nr:exodeoxyribonuclease V subunit alpha [Mycobacterium sp. shizuoka-1]GAY13892.1 RecBCD enzyme subunit RecD [Mycobacterium sp. shizuoka-1]